VVANASLDDTSNSALMAAWTSLYNLDNLAKPETGDAAEHRPSTVASAGSPAESVGQSPPATTDTGADPYLDSLPADDPGLLPEAMPAQTPSAATPLPPEMPSIPSFGGGGVPGFGMPGGLPLPGPLHGADDEPSPKDLGDALLDADDPEEPPSADKDGDGRPDEHDAESTASHPPATGPTTVTLPNGETVTAANPQLAAAIKAAAGGTPIADAFRQEGISIPPPGTAVADPVDPSRLTPGDIGMLTDRHALALGQSRALLNGQIQHISTVNGPHVADQLRDHLARFTGKGPEAFLFTSNRGNRLGKTTFEKTVKKGYAAVGKPALRVHDLRHTGATLAAQAGATTKELMTRLGHSTPAMSMRYQHASADRDAAIAARLSELAVTA
jgi:hypothetical protein